MELQKKQEILSKDFLFSKIDHYDVYKYYVGDFTINQVRKSPFHKDNNPSFSIYMRDGKLRHKDHSNDFYRGDCIDLVQQLFNLDTKQAVEKIAKDFGISKGEDNSQRITSLYTKPFMEQRRHSFIQVKTRSWTEKDAEYWKQFGITKDQLKKDEVYPLKEVFINRKKEGIEKEELVYGYRYNEGFKIYFPNRPKGEKWRSNIPITIVENLSVLEDLSITQVLIVKSKKDRLCLQGVFPDMHILNVQNESVSAFSSGLSEKLKGKQVYISYDSDEAGKRASLKITTEFGYKHINVPDIYVEKDGIKDWADLFKKYGPEPIINHFKTKKVN